MLRNQVTRKFVYLPESERLALTDQELFDYIKAGVVFEIEEYLLHVNHDAPITKNISFPRINSFRPAIVAGETGRTRAIVYKDSINRIDNLEDLLRGLLLDLNNAAEKNEEKTLSNVPKQLASSVVSFFYTTPQGSHDGLGNSSVLARNVAQALTFMFNIDRSKMKTVFDVIAKTGAVDSELKALLICLHRAIDPVLLRLSQPQRNVMNRE